MPLVVVDVVLDLPDALRAEATNLSAVLVERMRLAGHPSRFQLGRPYPGDPSQDGCEPHVSLFMLSVERAEIDELLTAVRAVAGTVAPIVASGHEYRPNPQGAPELHYHRSDPWHALQHAVVTAAEPLRRGRLREVDPAGEPLAGLVERLRREEPDGDRLRQLLDYGYDEIGDRFRPHVTLAWPADGAPPSLADLPGPDAFSGVLVDLAVHGMAGNGTCTTRYGGFTLAGGGPVGSAGAATHGGEQHDVRPVGR
ncbi:MAG TPA: hypothetical protein VFX70_17645 [Mycobacteriales bacterium]|nr:hypothetical protein [Mycobacteriales bacterium]